VHILSLKIWQLCCNNFNDFADSDQLAKFRATDNFEKSRGGNCPLPSGDTLFDVPWRALTNYDLGETRYKEVVGQSLDAAGCQLGPLATQRTSELPVVCVLLVGGLSRHVTLNTVLTERVEARQALGTLVRLETDLADEELFVDLLGQASAKRAGRRNHEDFVTERLPSC